MRIYTENDLFVGLGAGYHLADMWPNLIFFNDIGNTANLPIF